MPLDAQHGWRRDEMVTADEILATLGTEFSLAPDEQELAAPRPPRGSWWTAARRLSASSRR